MRIKALILDTNAFQMMRWIAAQEALILGVEARPIANALVDALVSGSQDRVFTMLVGDALQRTGLPAKNPLAEAVGREGPHAAMSDDAGQIMLYGVLRLGELTRPLKPAVLSRLQASSVSAMERTLLHALAALCSGAGSPESLAFRKIVREEIALAKRRGVVRHPDFLALEALACGRYSLAEYEAVLPHAVSLLESSAAGLQVRSSAALVVGKAGVKARPFESRVRAALANMEATTRTSVAGTSAAFALAYIGDDRKRDIDSALRLIGEHGHRTGWAFIAAAPACCCLIDDQLLGSIAVAVASDDQLVREGALTVLSMRGPLSRSHWPKLIGLLDDPNCSVRASAAEALGLIGTAYDVAPILSRKAASESCKLARMAIDDALVYLGWSGLLQHSASTQPARGTPE